MNSLPKSYVRRAPEAQFIWRLIVAALPHLAKFRVDDFGSMKQYSYSDDDVVLEVSREKMPGGPDDYYGMAKDKATGDRIYLNKDGGKIMYAIIDKLYRRQK
ncbi:MAG: hypothetical protein LBH81_03115 [Rickettsiales bacterium]|jgi:hypothetical protein|nr:hypothetical protein [Rickettsiales bacterium]